MGVMLLLAAAFQEDINPGSGGGGLIGAIFGGGAGLVWLTVVVDLRVPVEGLREGGQARMGAHRPDLQRGRASRDRGAVPMVDRAAPVPCVGIVGGILVSIDLAKAFGKDIGYGIGLVLVRVIFFPMLAFGDARYVGPVVGAPPARV